MGRPLESVRCGARCLRLQDRRALQTPIRLQSEAELGRGPDRNGKIICGVAMQPEGIQVADFDRVKPGHLGERGAKIHVGIVAIWRHDRVDLIVS